MADPLSVTAAFVGIIAATGQGVGILFNTIQNIRNAPESIKAIQTGLQQLRPLLAKLEYAIKEDPTELILSTEIKDALENCNQACTNFSVSLTRWTRRSSFLVHAKIGVFRQGRIRILNEQLGQSIKLLNITLGTATFIKMSRQEGPTKQIDDQVSGLQEKIDESRNGSKEMVRFSQPVLPLDEDEDKMERSTAITDGDERTSEETPEAVVSQSIKQKFGDIETTKGIAIVGRYEDKNGRANYDQETTKVHTHGGGISIVGVVNNLDINALLAKMGPS